MAVNSCHQEYAEECEILICVDAPAPHNPGLYQRLRFGLLASSWLPSPLGIFLWSALHVMLLIVGGPVFWVLGVLTAFLYSSVFMFGMMVFSICITLVSGALFALGVDLVVLPVQLIMFCWSLVAGHEPIFERWGVFCSPALFWETFKSGIGDMFWEYVPFGVPCMSGSLYKGSKDRQLKTWARWCGEVVHMHEAIAL